MTDVSSERDRNDNGSGSETNAGATLRGPAGVKIQRRTWHFVSLVGLVIFGAALVVGYLSAANDNARVHRMKSQGIPVTIRVVDCIGNIGGSGSNSAGYTCRGSYQVQRTNYTEIIGSLNSFSAPGTKLPGVADPSRPSTVILASTVRTSTTSDAPYIPLGILTVIFLALVMGLLKSIRRH